MTPDHVLIVKLRNQIVALERAARDDETSEGADPTDAEMLCAHYKYMHQRVMTTINEINALLK